jgi:hypothetical protein
MKIETVHYEVNWAKFRKGYSFFVPCIDTAKAKAELGRVARRLKMELLMKVVIEEGVKGLRVWRL